jgi:hypothetical protein
MKNQHLTYRTSVPSDAYMLILSEQDQAEVDLVRGELSSIDLVAESIRISETCVTVLNQLGLVVSVFGLRDIPEIGCAAPWMLSSSLLKLHAREVMVTARKVVTQWRADSRPKFNWIATANHSAKAFIQRLGFVIVPHTEERPGFDFFFLPTSCATQ